jgi:hypothetical protein
MASDCGREEMEPNGWRTDDVLVLSDEEFLLAYDKPPAAENALSRVLPRFFCPVSSGKPSHLLFTLGTCSGSFFDTLADAPVADGRAPRVAAAFLCCSAYCSNANVDGSLRVRKPNMPFFFFFGWASACCLLREVVALAVVSTECLVGLLHDVVLEDRSCVEAVLVVEGLADASRLWLWSDVVVLAVLTDDLLRTASFGTLTVVLGSGMDFGSVIGMR